MPQRILFALLLASQAWGEPQHMLQWVLPRGGTRGTTVEVNLHGIYLSDPREVLFYGRGIKASTFAPGAKADEDVKVRFDIAPDCPLGEHVLRLRTATGLSDAVTFWVSCFPTVMETEKKIGDNDTIATAQAVPMNSTVEGQIHPGDRPDRDVYSVAARQGERVSVEVESVRLGTLHYSTGEHDLSVRIRDATGRELAHDDDSAMFVQDPVVSIVAPRTEKNFVAIAQPRFQPPRLVRYPVPIGNFPQPTSIYPPSAQ